MPEGVEGNRVSNLEKVERIAEGLRQESYYLFRNDCFTKSIRLKRRCKALGILARVVICIGLARACLFGRWLIILVIHGWSEVEGKRIEVSRPLGSSGMWDIVPVNIRPIIAVWF